MAMTRYERAAKDQLMDLLAKQGYKTYSLLLHYLDVNLTENPNTIAFIDTEKACITINKHLRLNQVSTVVRHEILHQVFAHTQRAVEISKRGGNFKNIPHDIFNMAADFEISNLGYTDNDKDIARYIILNNRTLKGLVTEDHYADWTDKSFEEMLELLLDKKNEISKQLKQQLKDMQSQQSEETSEITELEEVIREMEQAIEAAEESSEENKERAAEKQQASNECDNENASKEMQQGAEEAEEEAQENEQVADTLKRLRGKAARLKRKAEQLNIDPTLTAEQKEKEAEEIAKKAAVFKKILENPNLDTAIRTETNSVITKLANEKNREKEVNKYRGDAITQFELSLIKFIKKQIGDSRESSWKKINTVYTGTSVLRPARANQRLKKIPLINIYFDRSWSFKNYPEKTKAAEAVIQLLDKYVRQGKLKIDIYYGSTGVFTDRKKAEQVSGGMEGNPVITHIQETKPDNVIILTDSDSGVDGSKSVTVPGAVWILFFESQSNLGEYITGQMETQTYFSKGN